MPHTQAEQSVSEVGVSLDPASLRGQSTSNDTRYTIAVRGRADEHWADAYMSVQGESVPHRKFQLDRRSRTIAFNCPTVEGPAFVFEMLERLEELLELADRRAEFGRPQAPLAPPPLRPIA
jgi:hypothetical protein